MLCVVMGVSSFTRTIPLQNIYTSCVVTGVRIRRVYSYMEYIHTCSHRASIRRVYSYMEYIHSVCCHGGESSHWDYSFGEYVYAACSHRGEDSPGIFLYEIYNAVCSHGGELSSPGLFLYAICIRRV